MPPTSSHPILWPRLLVTTIHHRAPCRVPARSFFWYTMAVRKQFWDKKASIGLVANNAFSQYINQASTTSGPGFNQESLRQLPFRSFGITLSYKFGKLEFLKNKDKEGREDNGGQMPAEPMGK
jgi:ferric enterobactin receptor